MKLTHYIVLVIIMCFGQNLSGQEVDSLLKKERITDTTLVKKDTIPFSFPSDSLQSDILTRDSPSTVSNPTSDVKISKDGLDDIIDYGSTDSSYVDLKENQIHLFGNAFVKYKEYDLKAGYIIFDFDDNEASAFRLKNALGIMEQKPDFTDGTNKFKSNGLRFNFKTNKGLIYDAITQEGEFTIHGTKTKFVSKDSDSTSVDDQIFNEHALITTCDADHPHYGIHSLKLKVIPGKLAIIGLSQLEIMGIPTPVVLPFGFFPLVEGRSSGLIFPSDYEYNEQLGLGFREIGYYFPINDYFDLRVTGDIYTRGTHRINIRSNYKKRYKHKGNIKFSYANNIGESSVDASRTSNKAFSLTISHDQDSKAHPYRKIGGSINLSTNRFDQVNSTSFENVVNNKIRSNFFYKHSMPGTPFSFSANFAHNQDNNTRKVDITLPDVALRMNTIYPFKSNRGGEEKWFEKINVRYDAKFKNYVEATDTTLFTSETLDNLQTGLSHNANAGASFNALKYFNITTSADFEQFVFTRTQRRELDPTLILDTIGYEFNQVRDSTAIIDTTYGTVNQFYENGLASLEKFNLSVNVATQLFATKRFSKGWLRGLRHTMKPSIGFTYSPDTESKYEREVLLSSDPNRSDEIDSYNPFRGGAFNPSLSQEQMALTYRIANLFEGKYYSKADSTEKKFKLLNNLNIDGRYNFAADSLKFSPLNIRGNTSFFKGITSINFRATYNFYKKDENGRLINTTVWSKDRRPLEFDNFNITVSNGLTLAQIREFFGASKKTAKRDPNASQGKSKVSLGEWVDNFRFSHSFDYIIRRENDGRDTSFVRAHSIKVSGRVQLTDSWNMSVNNISYDLVNKSFVYPQFSLSRDLHCWTMQFTWTPAIEVYSFFIGVKSNSLSFLKYNYGQRNAGRLTNFR
ncbi:MAG: putative LPS assembly protein LptD [Saprospiraceae bacterium]|nr:putative LPS assembly protein LptD [Saprospiraceae bacterium]